MTQNISRDEAMYFLIFAVAAADQIEGGIFSDTAMVSDDEWKYLEDLVATENLLLSENIQVNKSWGSADDLNFYGMKTDTFDHGDGPNADAVSACIAVMKEQSKIDQYKTLYYMGLMACVTGEPSDKESEVIANALVRLEISDEAWDFIADASDISDLAELTAISGVDLLNELVALNGIGEKTAMDVLEVFPNSASLVKASLSALQEIDSVSARNALVIKEKYK
jgi:hypothetical protein